MIKYRGYKILNGYKIVNKSNKLSGHTWTEKIFNSRFYVMGIGVFSTRYWYNLELCKKYIDFVIKFKIGKNEENTRLDQRKI